MSAPGTHRVTPWLLGFAAVALATSLAGAHPASRSLQDEPRDLFKQAAEQSSTELFLGLLDSPFDPLPQLVQRLEGRRPAPSILGLPSAVQAWLGDRDLPLAHWERGVLIAQTVIQHRGRSAQLSDLLKVSAPRPFEDSGDVLTAATEQGFQRALQEVLERDTEAAEALVSPLRRAHPILRPGSIRALGGHRSPGALKALLRLHGEWEDLDGALLSQASRIARGVNLDDPSLLGSLRQALGRGSQETIRSRVLCLAWLNDKACVPELVELMQAPNTGIRQSCWWALKRLTNLGLRDDPKASEHWHNGELKWWETSAPAVLEKLREPDPAVQLAGVRDLSRRRAPYDKIVRELMWAVEHTEPAAASLAALTLGRMDAYEARPVLLRTRHRDPAIARSAHGVLASWGEFDEPEQAR